MDLEAFMRDRLRQYGLSPREQDVAFFWILDHTYKEISRLLAISELTARTIIRNIHGKMGVRSKASLILKVMREGVEFGRPLQPLPS